jgi:hypothetical protein
MNSKERKRLLVAIKAAIKKVYKKYPLRKSRTTASTLLVVAIKKAYKEYPLKRPPQSPKAEWYEPDWLWRTILRSIGTLGGVRGGVLQHDRRVSFSALRACNKATDREGRITRALHDARVRYPDKKRPWLLENFRIIVDSGGQKAVKDELEARPDCDAKINFLKSTFWGIGPKYARNMMMDVYHPDFQESIAVDSRLQEILDVFALSFLDYEDKENFLLEVAHKARLNGWQLDRLMFGHRDAVLVALEQNVR